MLERGLSLLFILVVGRCGGLFLEDPHATTMDRPLESAMWQLGVRGMKEGSATP